MADRKPSTLTADISTPREQGDIARGQLRSQVSGESVDAIRISRLTNSGKKALAEHLNIPFDETNEKGRTKKRNIDDVFGDLPDTISLLELGQIEGFKASGFKAELKKELRGFEAIQDKGLISQDALAGIFQFDISPEEAEGFGVDPQKFAQTPEERNLGALTSVAESAIRQLSGGSDLIEQGLATKRGDFSSERNQDILQASNELFGSSLAGSGFRDSGLASLEQTVAGRNALSGFADNDIRTGLAVGQGAQGQLAFASPLSVPSFRLGLEQERVDAQTFGQLLDFTVRSQESATSALGQQATIDSIIGGVQAAGSVGAGVGSFFQSGPQSTTNNTNLGTGTLNTR